MDPQPAWTKVGEIKICPKGWPLLPKVEEQPGLYRITLHDGRVYIGEAEDLKRRLYEYRRPKPGVEGEHLVHQALQQAQGGKLEICLDPRWTVRAVRRRFEREVINEASASGQRLLNGAGKDKTRRLEARIAYHERQIEALRSRLAALQSLSDAVSDPAINEQNKSVP